MASFKTEREKNKWDAIQASAGTTIDKMLVGQATPADLKSLSALLSKQQALAGKIFDEGIASAEATADAIVDKLNADRVALGKPALSSKAQDRVFKRTFQEVLSSSAEDILGSIKDQLDEHFENAQNETQTLIDSAFDRIKALSGKNADDTKPKLKIPGQANAGAAPASSDHLTRLSGSSLPPDAPKPASAYTRLQSFFSSDKPSVAEPRIHKSLGDVMAARGVRSDKDIIRNIEALNKSDTSIQARSPIDQQIAVALKANNELRQKAMSEWDRISLKEDEDKKSSVWLRNIKRWFGEGKSKVKGAFSNSTGLLGKLVNPLLLALTSPQLISTIATGISKYLNFETISKFLADSWEDVKDGGSKMVDWVINKIKSLLGLGKETVNGPGGVSASVSSAASAAPKDANPADAKKNIPLLEQQLAELKNRLAKAQKIDSDSRAAGTSTPTDVRTTLTYAPEQIKATQVRLAYYKAAQPTAGSDVTSIQSLTGVPSTGSDSALAQTSSVGSASTAVTPASVLSASSASPKAATKVAPDDKPVNSEGISVPNPMLQPPAAASSAREGAIAGNSVSIGSFGFNSGDDTLNLINAGALA